MDFNEVAQARLAENTAESNEEPDTLSKSFNAAPGPEIQGRAIDDAAQAERLLRILRLLDR